MSSTIILRFIFSFGNLTVVFLQIDFIVVELVLLCFALPEVYEPHVFLVLLLLLYLMIPVGFQGKKVAPIFSQALMEEL